MLWGSIIRYNLCSSITKQHFKLERKNKLLCKYIVLVFSELLQISAEINLIKVL